MDGWAVKLTMEGSMLSQASAESPGGMVLVTFADKFIWSKFEPLKASPKGKAQGWAE
ncbi:MAG: hypothetical protein ACRESI_05715 [Gammaproteobacteria bacterium]